MEGQLQYLASLWLQQQAEKENTSVAELNERLQKATLEEKPEGELKITSVYLKKITTRDAQTALQHRPRPRRTSSESRLKRTAPCEKTLKKDGFCAYCAKLSMQGLTKAAMSESHEVTDDLGGHHFSFDDLWYSAKTCPLCRLFILAFEDRARDTSGQNAQRLENASKEGGRFKIWARNTDLDNRLKQDEALTRLVLQWIGNSGKYEEIELLLVASPDCAASAHINTNTAVGVLNGKADSEDSIQMLRRYLQFCNETHKRCSPGPHFSPKSLTREVIGNPRKPLAKARLPTRVIVAMWEVFGKSKPYLLVTNRQLQGTFATLSYRWSEHAQLKTTRKTLEAHTQVLDIVGPRNGTKTFFDAISVCRVLGIPFLWIDALCIIQHDPDDPLSNLDDWTREAKDMGRIYSESALTIAATGASDDPSNGLFGDRSAFHQYVEVPYRETKSDDPDGSFYVSLVPRGFDSEVSTSPLYNRGWVLQERLLSRRYLCFGKTQWFWQCRECTIAEVSGTEDHSVGTGSAFFEDDPHGLYDEDTKFLKRWMRIVEAYTRLDFTVKSDRFIAIQGLVDEGEASRKEKNYYGVWSTLLHVQLLWWIGQSVDGTSLDPESRAEQTKVSEDEYRPSWSWMSTSQPVCYLKTLGDGDEHWGPVPDHPVLQDYFKTEGIRTVKSAFDTHHFVTPTQTVNGITKPLLYLLKAALEPVDLDLVPIEDEKPPRPAKSERSAWDAYMNRDVHHTKIKSKNREEWDGKTLGACNLDNDFYRSASAECYCLAISERWLEKDGEKRLQSVNVLIVQVRGRGKMLFAKRVGVGFISEVAWYKDWRRANLTMT